LCCGRTFLSAGLVDNAKAELKRVVETLIPFAERGVPIVGLGAELSSNIARRTAVASLRHRCEDSQRPCLLFEEFLVREAETGQLKLPLGAIDKNALVHGHCHQKSFGAFAPVENPAAGAGLKVEKDRVELLRHGRRLRLARTPTMCRSKWRKHPCFPLCARLPMTR
jgi:Fe-S oxidoreductase